MDADPCRPATPPRQDATVRALILDADRRSQRLAGWVRLGIGAVLALIPAFGGSALKGHGAVLVTMFALYFAIAIASLVLARPRFFRPWLAGVFVVADVVWYYAALILGLLIFQLPPNAFGELPTFAVIFLFIALAGMRYTPGALIAGLVTFALFDTILIAVVLSGTWPGAPLNDAPLHGLGPVLFRIGCVIATAFVVGLSSWRARDTLACGIAASRERDAVEGLFGRYVPPAVARAVIADGGAMAPVARDATILFVDLEGFTSLAESLAPDQVLDLVNAWFAEVEQALSAEGGVITQYQGDAVLATFNLPVEQPNHADHALAAARAIQAVADTSRFQGRRLRARIGIASGPVVGGNAGGRQRIGYTVHGDTVNVAARLEALNKDLNTRVLISEGTRARLTGRWPLRPVGTVPVRGHAPVAVFSLGETTGCGTPRGRGAE